MVQTWSGVRAAQRASGTLLNTYTTAKSVINSQALAPFNPNEQYLGKQIRVTAVMGISNVVTAQPTFTFQVMYGTLAAPIVAWSSGAILTSTTAHTVIPAKLVVDLRLDAEGSATAAHWIGVGHLSGIMWVATGAVADSAYGSGLLVPAATPAQGTGFDTTIAALLDFWVGISVSNAGNGVQVFEYYVEDLN